MANTKVIVEKTLQFKDEKGATVTVERSDEPQSLPAEIAKEALERGLARKYERKKAEEQPAETGSGE